MWVWYILHDSEHTLASIIIFCYHISREVSASVRSTPLGNAKASDSKNGQTCTALARFFFILVIDSLSEPDYLLSSL